MATPLYYANPRQTEFTAHIVDVREDKGEVWVALDKTCFYPEGGGQPPDTGWLDDIGVTDVQKREGEIYHRTEKRPAGEHVTGRIDWARRYDFMQQHTGQHIISAAFMQVGEHGTVSVRQGEEITTVDIEAQSLPQEVLDEVERRAHEAICANLTVRDFEVTEDQIGSLELRRPPKVGGTIRIVEIESFDRVACGGVHTAATGEVGMVKLVGTETIRGNVRTMWKIGDRARADYRVKHEVVTTLVDLLSAKPEEIAERVRKIEDRLREREYEIGGLQKRLAAAEASRLRVAAEENGETAVVTHAFLNEDKTLFRAVAESLAEHPGTLACLTNTQDEQLLWAIASSPDRSLDFTAVKEELLPLIEGTGGGKPPLWQGVGRRPDAGEAFLRAFREHFPA